MNKKLEKFNGIYLYRVLFTLMIMVYHFDTHFFIRANFVKGGVFGWYIAVEFFFVVSGFLLAKKVLGDGKEPTSFKEYLGSRLTAIYPAYLIAFVFTFLIKALLTDWIQGPLDGLVKILSSLPEAFMLQGFAFGNTPLINLTAWYISVLMISSLVLFALLKWAKKIFLMVLAPVMIAGGLIYLYLSTGNLDAITMVGGFKNNTALVRGIAEMCLGVYAYLLHRKVLTIKLTDRTVLAAKLIGATLFGSVAVLSIRYGLMKLDFLYLCFIWVGVIIAFIPWKEGACPGVKKVLFSLSNVSLNVYLLHNAFREWIFPKIFTKEAMYALPVKIMIMLLYITVVFAVGYLLEIPCKNIKNRMKSRN